MLDIDPQIQPKNSGSPTSYAVHGIHRSPLSIPLLILVESFSSFVMGVFIRTLYSWCPSVMPERKPNKQLSYTSLVYGWDCAFYSAFYLSYGFFSPVYRRCDTIISSDSHYRLVILCESLQE